MIAKDKGIIYVPYALRTLSAVSILCAPIFVNMFAGIGISGIVRTLIMMVLCYGTLFLYFIKFPKLIPIDVIAITVLLVLIYWISILMHPEYIDSISVEMWSNIVSPYSGIVCLLVIRMFDDHDDLIDILTIVAVISFVYYAFQSIAAINKGYWTVIVDGVVRQQSYSMSFGYNMLVPTILLGFRGFMEKRKAYIVLFFIGGLEIFFSWLFKLYKLFPC